MTVAISGIGTWLPDTVRTNAEWPSDFGASRGAGGLDRAFNDIPPSADPISAAILERDLEREARDPFLGGVRRRVSDLSTTAPLAEAAAARAALADAGIAASDVDLLMSYAFVPEALIPPTGCTVAHLIGANRAHVIGVDTACASAIAQIEIACAYLETGRARVALLTQSHLLLRAMPMLHPACPGLGDGATALVLTRSSHGLLVRATYGVTHGQYASAVTWVRGNGEPGQPPWYLAGGDFRLGSPMLHDQVKLMMRETVSFGSLTVREAAARAEIAVDRIAVLAAVQPRGFIPGAIAERLGIDRERAVTTYEDIAHVGACGPVFNLHRACERGLVKSGSVVALYGQGAGFTRSAALLEQRA